MTQQPLPPQESLRAPSRYAAFISFRHIDPDERWAKWLHTLLETYRVPRALLKGRATNRVGRAFRDAEELAACADLPNELKSALADSEYLIVTCSPGTAGSVWVEQEVREFAALGRAHRILALLVRGDPAEAFPPVFKEVGINPLAADVRIDSRRSRSDAGRRLIATLIGCTYDDLKQREHERRLRQVVAASFVLAATAVAFAVIAVIALIQRDLARSRELATNSGYFLTDDAELSVLLANEATRIWPTDQAEDALREALSRDRLRHVLPGTTGPLTRVTFSPDGTRLVTGSERGMLQLWDATTFRPLMSIPAHKTPIATVAFSPNGLLLVTASAGDPVARIWNVNDGSLIHELKGHRGGITHAEFSHDGKSVVTSSNDHTAHVWNALTGESTATLSGHADTVNTALFSLDDRSVFTAGEDELAIKWDLATGKPPVKYPAYGPVRSLALSPDGRLVATGSRGFAEILDADLHPQCELLGHDSEHYVIGARFSPDSKVLATAGDDGFSLVADMKTIGPGNICSTTKLMGHIGALNSVVFDASGGSVMTVSADHTARIWETRTGRLMSRLVGQQGPLTDVSVSPDGQFAATASTDGSTRIWQLNSSALLRTLPGSQVVVAPAGSRALTWSDTSTALWNIDDGRQMAKLAGQTQKIKEALFSADGALLLTVDEGGAARVWNPENGKRLHEFHSDATPLAHGALSHDGRQIAVASDVGLLTIWNLETEKRQAQWRGHAAAVNSLMFSSDDRRLLTTSDDGTARIWDPSSGKALLVYHGHSGPITRATFTADSQLVISVDSSDKSLTPRHLGNYPIPVWDSHTGKVRFTLSGHIDYIHDVVLSPNGKLAVSVSEDTTAIVWNVTTGAKLSVLSGHQSGVVRAAFSADSKFIATTEAECALRVWDARSGRMMLELGEEAGCFDHPQFSADSRSIIASSNQRIKGHPDTQEIAILPCELCVDTTGLVALAHERLSRGLSAGEKARYLR